jgi:hypothetical protein
MLDVASGWRSGRSMRVINDAMNNNIKTYNDAKEATPRRGINTKIEKGARTALFS